MGQDAGMPDLQNYRFPTGSRGNGDTQTGFFYQQLILLECCRKIKG
jgi:hypothetical protein